MNFIKLEDGRYINLDHVKGIGIFESFGFYKISFLMGYDKDGKSIEKIISFKSEEEQKDFIRENLYEIYRG